MARKSQRCTANDKSGSRCGRMCPLGSVLCSVHDPSRKGGTFEASDDPVVILRRLMKDRDPRVRLRAVNAFLARQAKEERGCPRCSDDAERCASIDEALRRGTPEQLDQLRALIRAAKDLRAVMVAQPVYEEPSNVDTAPPAVCASADVPEPSTVCAGMDAASPDSTADAFGLAEGEESL